MIERRDEELSHIYRDAEGPRPPQRVDDNILAASQRVAGTVRRPAGLRFSRRWGTPVAIAATVLVTSTLALMVFERQSGVDTVAPPVPRADRPAKVSQPETQRAPQAEKSSPAGKSPPAEIQRAAPAGKSPVAAPPRPEKAPDTPGPQAAPRSDKVQQHTVETALSSERRATGQPARAPAIPRGVEILRKSEEVKPAPAAASPQAPVPDAQRVFDAQQRLRAMQAPPAAPAAGAVSEPAATLQSSGVAAPIANRLASPEAKERTPEKWIEDIRKLKTEGKATEAERELAEFKKRYSDYILPEDLR
jgi:hypothetical protein